MILIENKITGDVCVTNTKNWKNALKNLKYANEREHLVLILKSSSFINSLGLYGVYEDTSIHAQIIKGDYREFSQCETLDILNRR